MIPKKFKLIIKWSKKEDDFVIEYPRKCDCAFAIMAFLTPRTHVRLSEITSKFEKRLYDNIIEWDYLKELWDRGYDKTTFKMEVAVDKYKLLEHFPHLLEDLTIKETEELKKLGWL